MNFLHLIYIYHIKQQQPQQQQVAKRRWRIQNGFQEENQENKETDS